MLVRWCWGRAFFGPVDDLPLLCCCPCTCLCFYFSCLLLLRFATAVRAEVVVREVLPLTRSFLAAPPPQMDWVDRVPARKPYIWSNDFHVTPIACTAPLLEELGAEVHAEVDFSNCENHPKFCKSRLKVLEFDDWRGFSLDPCPSLIRRTFYDAYKRDPEFWRVDLFVCSHPTANCELFMPFNRSILVYATTRLEFGRHDEFIDWRKPLIDETSPDRWTDWVRNLKLIASRPTNLVAANNLFDVHYIK